MLNFSYVLCFLFEEGGGSSKNIAIFPHLSWTWYCWMSHACNTTVEGILFFVFQQKVQVDSIKKISFCAILENAISTLVCEESKR